MGFKSQTQKLGKRLGSTNLFRYFSVCKIEEGPPPHCINSPHNFNQHTKNQNKLAHPPSHILWHS